jgi:hypothetical protein
MSVRFSASNAGRLMACPASAHLELAIPNWVEPVRDETAGQKGVGTARHKMLEPLMELSPSDLQHMANLIQYVADLRKTRRFKVLIEETVTAEWLASKPKTTADQVLYTQDELHIIDYKWGKIPVSVLDNVQLLFYAVCYAPLAPKAKQVTLHILQPYADNYDKVVVTTTELAKFMEEAMAAEAKVLAKDLSFGPSDHCMFCPANPHSRGDKGKPLCPPMMQMLYPTARVDEDAILGLD